jgi:hypothetical protein
MNRNKKRQILTESTHIPSCLEDIIPVLTNALMYEQMANNVNRNISNSSLECGFRPGYSIMTALVLKT